MLASAVHCGGAARWCRTVVVPEWAGLLLSDGASHDRPSSARRTACSSSDRRRVASFCPDGPHSPRWTTYSSIDRRCAVLVLRDRPSSARRTTSSSSDHGIRANVAVGGGLCGRSCMRWSAGTHVVGGVQAVSEVAAGWARVGLHGADRIGVSAAGWGVAGVSATAGVRAPGNGNLPWRRRPVPASAHAPAPAHALALARSAEPAPVWGVTRIRGRKMKLSGIDSTLLRLD